ncbi:hypothetical protein [Flavobacterium sp. TAB 87]|uniref:DUF922 domain-containing protein n=1 Tax=Flavobacterium sp. TAB 87 TaxID=1729581 RepID=UPI0012FB1E5F|nr:hypothetical protein [Flavobacterium sp. TAB 87]
MAQFLAYINLIVKTDRLLLKIRYFLLKAKNNMMKQMTFYFLLLFICSSNIPFELPTATTIADERDKIIWSSNRKLIWNDFQGRRRDANSNKVAETSSNIKISYQYSKNRISNYTVEAAFSKQNSWTKTDKKAVLAHEQLHFDITELYARKIRKAFDILAARNDNSVQNYNKVYDENTRAWKKMQIDYDNQVYGNTESQEQWIREIEQELNKLENYKSR